MPSIPQHYLDSTLAVGRSDENSEIHWMGTGIIVGWLIPDQSPERYYAFLVTNRHVVEGESAVVIRFNLIEPPETIGFKVSLTSPDKRPVVTFHSDDEIDVAVVKLDDEILQSSGVNIQAFRSNRDIYPLRGGPRDLREGGSVFVLGYPLGLVSDKRQFAICRGGCIARIRDLYAGETKDFLIDAGVFPGNSGGPVVARLPMYSGLVVSLIGIVHGYVPYRETAISEQTGEPRITFEENSGLAAVVPIDYAWECMALNVRDNVPFATLIPM
jgi:S1-C subfamily serine protease